MSLLAIVPLTVALTALVYVNLFRGGLFKSRTGKGWDLWHQSGRVKSIIATPLAVFMWFVITVVIVRNL